MVILRDYQTRISNDAHKLLLKKRITYLAMEVRLGKTLTALQTCNLLAGTQPSFRVLFVTKKKAIGSIQTDYNNFKPNFELEVTNYQSLHKVSANKRFDVVIADESHSLISGFPKPPVAYKLLRNLLDKHTYYIMLSGTPFPESKSQLYHQFNVSPHSPFKNYKSFYLWAKDFVNIKQVDYGFGKVNDYSNSIDYLIDPHTRPYFLTFTQEQAGFDMTVEEEILHCEMKSSTYGIIDLLKKDRVINGDNGVVLGDTPVKLMGKIRQMCSGTVLYEEGDGKVFDNTKAQFIKEEFKGKKIAILYLYKLELVMLKEAFPDWTDDPMEFNESSDKVFIGQLMASCEGINLSTADALIYINIDFSCKTYIQSKDRMTSKDRTKANNVYFVFALNGIEDSIYKRVKAKEDYSSSIFMKENKLGKIDQLKLML